MRIYSFINIFLYGHKQFNFENNQPILSLILYHKIPGKEIYGGMWDFNR